MTEIVTKVYWYVLFLVILTAPVEEAFATAGATTIDVSVTVMESSCTINDGKTITVDFGSVMVNQINEATASVPITISCDEVPSGTLSMAVNGTASSFNTKALETDVSDLGITLMSPSKDMLDLNTFYDVSNVFGLSSKVGSFNLTAHLVSNDGSTITGGAFNASATLVLQVS